jgi:hypothetical protein
LNYLIPNKIVTKLKKRAAVILSPSIKMGEESQLPMVTPGQPLSRFPSFPAVGPKSKKPTGHFHLAGGFRTLSWFTC